MPGVTTLGVLHDKLGAEENLFARTRMVLEESTNMVLVVTLLAASERRVDIGSMPEVDSIGEATGKNGVDLVLTNRFTVGCGKTHGSEADTADLFAGRMIDGDDVDAAHYPSYAVSWSVLFAV